mgnify:FL=1
MRFIMKIENQIIKPRFESSPEIEAYRENQLKVVDEIPGVRGNETYVRKTRTLDCLDIRQISSPEEVRHMFTEEEYNVKSLIRYCFKAKISQLEKDVLKGMTVENFKREKARNNSDPFSHSQL